MKVWERITNFFTATRRADRLQERNDCLRLELERATLAIGAACAKRDDYADRYSALRAQLAQVRVSQSTTSRAGWEVMCFIPEEVITRYHLTTAANGGADFRWFVKRITMELVALAVKGITRVRANGTCCALVFEPLNMKEPVRAPRFVQALWDQEGSFKMSDKCWDQRTEEQRVRGC